MAKSTPRGTGILARRADRANAGRVIAARVTNAAIVRLAVWSPEACGCSFSSLVPEVRSVASEPARGLGRSRQVSEPVDCC